MAEAAVTVTKQGGTVLEGEVIARLRRRESSAGILAERREARESWDLKLSTTGAISPVFSGCCAWFRSGCREVGPWIGTVVGAGVVGVGGAEM